MREVFTYTWKAVTYMRKVTHDAASVPGNAVEGALSTAFLFRYATKRVTCPVWTIDYAMPVTPFAVRVTTFAV